MQLTGANFIGYETSAASETTFQGITAAQPIGQFHPATETEINRAMQKAQAAFQAYRRCSGQEKAVFLNAIAAEIEALGDDLIQTVMAESGLPEARVTGERGRTCGQLRQFAAYVEEGSWVEAIIDHGNPERQPLPKPDIRKMLVAMGPVVVFTASNFPLAFSTAGGDTASALAAGCPVVVKGHDAHPATNEMIAIAIQKAAKQTGMPDGVFSSVNGDYAVGQALVSHPLTTAVAFTGSQRGGRALFDLANQRPNPIPVFAEMGSVNPVFVLPAILEDKLEGVARQIGGSVSMGAGQFCTCPGLVFIPEKKADEFLKVLSTALQAVQPQCMLNRRIFESYLRSLDAMLEHNEVAVVYEGDLQQAPFITPSLGVTNVQAFLKNPHLQEEVFGPFTLVVAYKDASQLPELAAAVQGQLTATVFGEPEELVSNGDLFETLQGIAGRLIINGVPTGVEVCHAMQHGGPYPASTDSRFSSVGTSAIRRFTRPVAFQNFPQTLLPPALRDANPLKIWRLEDGAFRK
jgi:NADP-dependent aldehyde dehydrogenase